MNVLDSVSSQRLQMSTHVDPPTPASIAAAKLDARAQLRLIAAHAAEQLGHGLGLWRDWEAETEIAYCVRCRRSAVIDPVRDPHLAGAALSERCRSLTGVPALEDVDRHDAQLGLVNLVEKYGAKTVIRWATNAAAMLGQEI